MAQTYDVIVDGMVIGKVERAVGLERGWAAFKPLIIDGQTFYQEVYPSGISWPTRKLAEFALRTSAAEARQLIRDSTKSQKSLEVR